MTPKMPYRDEKIILKIVENRNFCNKESISLTKKIARFFKTQEFAVLYGF